MLQIEEGPDDFERLVALIVERLEQLGVDGEPDLWEPTELQETP